MLYLKYFESNISYQEIQQFQYNEVLPFAEFNDDIKIGDNVNALKFTPKEYSIIDDHVKKYGCESVTNAYTLYILRDTYTEMIIHKLSDEWFYVIYDPNIKNAMLDKYYKCDQIDGLLQLLDDKLSHMNENSEYKSGYYEDISDDKYFDEIIYDKIEPLTSDEINKINNILSKVYLRLEIGEENYIKELNSKLTKMCFMKVKDEWFYVQFGNHEFYKCDQFTGFTQLLKDKLL